MLIRQYALAKLIETDAEEIDKMIKAVKIERVIAFPRIGSFNLNIKSVKVLANEDTLLRIHCCS